MNPTNPGVYVGETKYQGLSLYKKLTERLKDECLWEMVDKARYIAEGILKDILSEGHAKGYVENINYENIKFCVPDTRRDTLIGGKQVSSSSGQFYPGTELYPANKYTADMIALLRELKE